MRQRPRTLRNENMPRILHVLRVAHAHGYAAMSYAPRPRTSESAQAWGSTPWYVHAQDSEHRAVCTKGSTLMAACGQATQTQLRASTKGAHLGARENPGNVPRCACPQGCAPKSACTFPSTRAPRCAHQVLHMACCVRTL